MSPLGVLVRENTHEYSAYTGEGFVRSWKLNLRLNDTS